MTHIQPTQFVRNGPLATKYATIINFDDCKTFATFQATFFDADNVQVHQQTVPLNGQDYLDWDGSNAFPPIWVAKELELTIVPSHIEETPIEE